ncbi:unnamed protein product [Rotaria sp. Silwood2]|nr:unnamed protein product [Rotaria sp. Silwood2]CAF3050553.1 unnamed protein product [Rotaria sp. Silwood2]CAF3376473.1 unnamed protein product [Rotaria sp. Silwood2]CAF4213437.1 unnamed protein product [Rotaria sp. Silwood2]CAF4407049.1 unnamed protein product [Rotaria sp. Silwood2]
MGYNFFINLCLILSCIYGLSNELYLGINDIHEIVSTNVSSNLTNGYQHQMILQEVKNLFEQYPWKIIKKGNDHHRKTSDIHSLRIDIQVLQRIIKDQRMMISDLIDYINNNSANVTFITDAIHNHHSQARRILTTWRNLIDLFLISIFIGYIIYLHLYRVGFNPCILFLSYFSKRSIGHPHQRQELQEQELGQTHALHGKKEPYASVISIAGGTF